jgi:hypothetical protein
MLSSGFNFIYSLTLLAMAAALKPATAIPAASAKGRANAIGIG